MYYSAKTVGFDASYTSHEKDSSYGLNPSGEWSTYHPGVLSFVIQRTGSSVPGWHRRIQLRLDSSTDYFREDWKITATDGILREVFDDKLHQIIYLYEITGRYMAFYPVIEPVYNVQKVDDVALGKFLSKLYATQSTFQGGVFVKELGETIHMIRRPLEALYGGFFKYLKTTQQRGSQLKRVTNVRRKAGRGSRIGIITDMLSNTWLEYVFGWRPLVADLQDACQALAHVVTYRAPSERVRASAEEFYSSSSARIRRGNGAYGYVDYTPMCRLGVKVIYTGSTTFDSDAKGAAIQDFGLGLSNFVPTIWEVIPYSFLVDYFVNVGEVLEGCMAATDRLIYCDKVVKLQSIMQPTDIQSHSNLMDLPPDSATKLLSFVCQPGAFVIEHSTYSRYKLDGRTLRPSLRLKFPAFDSLKWANMAALYAANRKTSNFLRN